MIDIIVAPAGLPTAPGTITNPIDLVNAQQLARVAVANGESVRVWLRGGLYRLIDTLRFDQRDSPQAGQTVLYSSYTGEVATLSGGQPIAHWDKVDDGLLRFKTDWKFRQLWFGERRGIRARYPREGKYLKIKRWYVDRVVDVQSTEVNGRAVVLPANDVRNIHIPATGGLELVIQRDWTQNRLKVRQIDYDQDDAILYIQDPEEFDAFGSLYPFKYPQGCHFEGIDDFLSEGGEWSLAGGELRYLPRWNDDPNNLDAVFPRLETLISVIGTPSNPVRNISFERLRLAHTTWNIPSLYGRIGTQGPFSFVPSVNDMPVANVGLTAAIQLRYCRSIKIERCTVRDTGANGIALERGAQNCTVNGNTLTSIAATGVILYSTKTLYHTFYWRPNFLSFSRGWQEDISGNSPLEDQCLANTITNNRISHCGLDYPDSCGIFAAHIADSIIEHNLITDIPWAGISCGWGFAPMPNQYNNKIRYNRIIRAMTLLVDAGAIYTLNRSTGTEIAENWISDLKLSDSAERRVLAGIMLDFGSAEMTVTRNIIENLTIETSGRPQDLVTPLLLNVQPTDNTISENHGIAGYVMPQATLDAIKQNAGVQAGY